MCVGLARAFLGGSLPAGASSLSLKRRDRLVRSLSPWRVEAWHTGVYLRGTSSQLCLEYEEGCLRVPRGVTDQDGSLCQNPGAYDVASQPIALACKGGFSSGAEGVKQGGRSPSPCSAASP